MEERYFALCTCLFPTLQTSSSVSCIHFPIIVTRCWFISSRHILDGAADVKDMERQNSKLKPSCVKSDPPFMLTSNANEPGASEAGDMQVTNVEEYHWPYFNIVSAAPKLHARAPGLNPTPKTFTGVPPDNGP